MTRNFVNDALKYVPSFVIPGLVGFVSIPIITRLFPPAEYGYYALAVATVAVLTTVLSWLPMSIIRFYPVYEKNKMLGNFYGSTISLMGVSVLAVSTAFLIVLLSVKTYIGAKLYLLMCIAIGVLVANCIFDTLQHFLMIRRQVSWYSTFAVWKSVGTLGIALLLIFFLKRGIESLLLAAIICIAVALPISWSKARPHAPLLNFKIDTSLAKKMAMYSVPLVIGNLAAWILSLSDRYILELFRETQEVGIYSVGYDIADRTVMMLASLIAAASGPILMHTWEKEQEDNSKHLLNKVTRYYLLLCVPAVVGLCALSKPIMRIMAAEEYFEGYKVIPFVTSGVLFLGLQQRFQAGFLLYKKTTPITLAVVSSGLLNLLLNFLFVPAYGYYAAAITTSVSYAFLLLLMIILSRRLFVWRFPLKSLVKVSLAAATMGIVTYYIGNGLTSSVGVNLVSGVCIGAAIYFLMLLLLGELSREDSLILRSFSPQK